MRKCIGMIYARKEEPRAEFKEEPRAELKEEPKEEPRELQT